jgi:hypothetical protein
MNGTEQSDSRIVPRKLANKAAGAAAEPMEGSGGTKANPSNPQKSCDADAVPLLLNRIL